MPWSPLPRIAFAVATYPFSASSPADLPLELGDELYIIEKGGRNGDWFRGYLVAPPSLLAGLTSTKGQTLEARVFSGIFPRSCVEVREVLGEDEDGSEDEGDNSNFGGSKPPLTNGHGLRGSGSIAGSVDSSPLASPQSVQQQMGRSISGSLNKGGGRHGKIRKSTSIQKKRSTNGSSSFMSLVLKRDPNAPRPPAPVPMLKIGDETPTSASEPLVDEIASCLREWHSTNLHELLLSRQYPLLDKMSSLVHALELSRRLFLHKVLTTQELKLLREKTVWDLVRGNKLFNGEVIVRDPVECGRLLTGEDSAIEVTKLQSIMSLLDERPAPHVNEKLTLHHLLIDVRAFVGASTDSTTLVIFLASRSPGQAAVALSESYIVEVPASGALTSLAKAGQVQTLFTDLASSDIGDLASAENELYLVMKVRATEYIMAGKPRSRGGSVSRDGLTSRNGEKPTTSGAGKPGRRSMMWGQKSQRSTFSRNAPISSKLNSLAEGADGRQSSTDGGPPDTADSRGPATRENGGTVSRAVTRTVAIGALRVDSLMKQNDEAEEVMTAWAPASGFRDDQKDMGEGWEDVIRDLMGSKSGNYEKSRKAERLQVHLKAFDNPNVDALIKATPTLLSSVPRTKKIGFSGAPTKPRSDIYITIDEAFLPRHALLSRPVGGASPLQSNLVGSNLQISLEVYRASGERIEGCIFASSNAEAQSSWESTTTERGEAWDQTIRLVIPSDDVPKCHLVMLISDVPNQPFAICHMPLWDQQAFLRDGHHSLFMYRYDSSSNTVKDTNGSGGYLTLPWNSRGKDDVSKDEAVTGPIATVRLQTYLCSTKFSQDKVLLGLLKWKQQPSEEVPELLKALVFVPEIEIVKLLDEVFDAIFSILFEYGGNDDYEDLVFSAIVTVLGIVHDRRFNLGPLVDQYAETKFRYPSATTCLVRSFTRLLAKPSDPETSRKLRATFKVVRHILKFITHGQDQQKIKEASIGLKTNSPGFTRHLRSIFKALDSLMRNTAPILVGSQTLAVQHFHTWLPELAGLLSREEILHIAIDFLDSCALVKGKLVLYKLVLIINYSKLELFSLPEQKAALGASTARWIAPHWGKTTEVTEQWREQVRLCCSIISTQVEGLGPEIPDYIPKVIDSYLALQSAPKSEKTRLSLLFPTTYPFPTKPVSGATQFDESLIELSAILSALSALPAGMQLELAEEEMATLIEDTLHVHLSILQCEAFPADWLSVRIFHHRSTMKTLEYLAGILLDLFLPDPDDDAENYNTKLWKVFFTTLLKLVGSDALALETFPEQKRRAVWKIAGDIREQGAALLRQTWEAIGWETSAEERQKYNLTKMGGYQVQYVPALVGPIVELCLSVHEGLRRVAVEVLQSMIVSEWTLSEDLSVIQTEMIDCLDRLFESKPLTESILQKLFINELLSLFEPLSKAVDDELYTSLKELISTTDEFLDLLVAVHSTDVTGEAAHMIHRLRLMEFLRDMQKEEIFIRYVHQLATLQADARNPTEAGLALRLHADLYDWDPTKIVPPLTDPEFPAQSQFDRKERIYFEIIKHFEEGEAWSCALDTYQELQAQYQANVYDFPKLARTQRAIATIYETISKAEKLVPKYFRVTYKGMGFLPSLRDKEFVFEGSPSERTSAFTDRMQEQHPSAQIITSGDVESVEGQFLQISALSPHRDLDHHVFQRTRVPQVVRDYLLSAHPQLFSVTSKRTTTGHVSEHSAEKIVYTAAESFPTILRRSEIIAVDHIKLGALQTALERIIRKTQEMIVVERRVAEGEEDMAPLLIDALKISVNPNSENSVARYRELLPIHIDGEEIEEVELQPLEIALKTALIDHAVMIKRCLAMFSKPLPRSQNVSQESKEELASSKHQYFNSSPSHKLHPSLITSILNSCADFEATFAPELASFTFPQPQRTNTRTLSWGISSPNRSEQRESLRILPKSHTNGTIATQDTSILDSPRNGRNRLSFLKKNPNPLGSAPVYPESARPGALGLVNGNANSTKIMTGVPEESLSSSRSRSKENRHSFFSGANTNGNGRRRENEIYKSSSGDRSVGHIADEGEWVTQSDLSLTNSAANTNPPRRSSSSQRPSSSTSKGVGSKVGSVRKRLSMLKLGKKSSKANILYDSVAEED